MSVKHYIKHIVTILSLCALGGLTWASDQDESSAEPEPKSGRDCISQSSIRDYQVLDEQNLIITGGAKRKYHVELYRRAFGLRSNWRIGVRSATSRVCGGSGDIIVEDGFGRMESIGIRSIRELDEVELDEILVRYGKKEPEFEQTPADVEVEGAEVEELD